MKLESADRHLRRKHSDCWSCKLERQMIQAISKLERQMIQGDMSGGAPPSRARG
jgi:hypothetical protein